MELIFEDSGFIVKPVSAPEEVQAAMELRHQVFRDELRWVPVSPDGSDRDDYDGFAEGIGVFTGRGELIGYVRLIPAPRPYMIEKEFACLLPEGGFRKTLEMAESTRICVRKDMRKEMVGGLSLAHLLYKAIYNWCLVNDRRHLVTIIEERYYIYLKRYFPFVPLAPFKPLGEGVMSGIVVLDWREFEERAGRRRPEFLGWMSTPVVHAPSVLQQHALY
ncbi:MAG: GNAT family N-acetyltransferase [Deltaproteobacteria bacterium]|nr:GNAT family N-acetyltransferase [Deltaproteobacteria bacterium]MBZ0219628.1 GNAT family N-acetyltransferase [Deltaproteobacteria bacterium]